MKHGTGRSAGQTSPRVLLALTLGCALSGCSAVNPINWYRDTMGISANDPGPDAPNAAALEAGGDKPYPNLGSVPPPPTRALSTEERASLTQQLVADRANARYIDEQLRAGPGPAVPGPGAAPPPVPLGQRAETAQKDAAPDADAAPKPSAAQPAPAKTAAAAPPVAAPIPPVQRPNALPPVPAAPPAATVAQAAPPAAAPAPAPRKRSPLVSLDAPDPDSASAPPPAAAAPPPAPVAAAAPPLASPTVRNVPEPETPRAPPPPSSLAGTQPAPQSPPSRATPPRYAALPPVASAPPQGSVLGQVSFAPNSTKLRPTDLQAVEAAALAQRQSGQPVRVVGHGGGSGDSPAQQLAGFRIALDRATAVAGALRQAGVPTDQILLETAPADGNASNQAELFLGN